MQSVKIACNLDRRRRAVAFGRGMQSKAVLHGHAKAGQKRASESAKALLRRNRLVSVMQEVRFLTLQPFVMRKGRHIADVMMRTDEDDMVGFARNFRTASTSVTPAFWDVCSESKLMTIKVSAAPRSPASSAVSLPSSADPFNLDHGIAGCARACSAKATKLCFIM